MDLLHAHPGPAAISLPVYPAHPPTDTVPYFWLPFSPQQCSISHVDLPEVSHNESMEVQVEEPYHWDDLSEVILSCTALPFTWKISPLSPGCMFSHGDDAADMAVSTLAAPDCSSSAAGMTE